MTERLLRTFGIIDDLKEKVLGKMSRNGETFVMNLIELIT